MKRGVNIMAQHDTTLTLKQMDDLQHWIEADSFKSQNNFNPIYLVIIRAWFHLLGVTEANTRDITDADFITAELSKHSNEREKYAELYLCTNNDPVKFINDGVDQICECYKFYSDLKDSQIVAKDYWICDDCQNLNEPTEDHCIYCGAERT